MRELTRNELYQNKRRFVKKSFKMKRISRVLFYFEALRSRDLGFETTAAHISPRLRGRRNGFARYNARNRRVRFEPCERKIFCRRASRTQRNILRDPFIAIKGVKKGRFFLGENDPLAVF